MKNNLCYHFVMIKKAELDKLVKKYETKEFFYDDPIGIPNKFNNKKDKEISGFMASLVAYGRREIFIKKLNQLLEIAQNEPYNFIINFEPKILGDFNYRFGKPEDFAQIFEILKNLYKNDGGLEELFKYGYANKNGLINPQLTSPQPSPKSGEGVLVDEPANSTNAGEVSYNKNENCLLLQYFSAGEGAVVCEAEPNSTNAGEVIDNMFIPVTDYFYSRAKNPKALGFKFMIPDARKGSAMKRMCMFLRWMVRKGNVDFGIWDFMPASDLLIPLDTHVARISREMGLLTRNANDFKAVIELTNNLKQFDPKDPVKYDFAIFGYGVNNK